MERREALKRITVLMGGAVSLSTATGILGGCRVGPRGDTFVARSLSSDQNDLVTTVSELIIPATDTGGAKAARVNEFIDKMLTDWYPEEDRTRFIAGLTNLDQRASQEGGKSFVDLEQSHQIEIMKDLEEGRVAWRQAAKQGSADRARPPFFEMMRELTIAGYYTSEIGASEELNYEIIFSSYEGDVPYAEIGKAWS